VICPDGANPKSFLATEFKFKSLLRDSVPVVSSLYASLVGLSRLVSHGFEIGFLMFYRNNNKKKSLSSIVFCLIIVLFGKITCLVRNLICSFPLSFVSTTAAGQVPSIVDTACAVELILSSCCQQKESFHSSYGKATQWH
jgi:hypothetical protein